MLTAAEIEPIVRDLFGDQIAQAGDASDSIADGVVIVYTNVLVKAGDHQHSKGSGGC